MKNHSAKLYQKPGETDIWLTPREYTQLLGKFDLDPCTAVDQPWLHARRNWTLKEDGLSRPWSGRVWMNPPYSEPLPWMERFVANANGIAMVYARVETKWFQLLGSKATLILFRAGRVEHCRIDGSRMTGIMGSAFIAYGKANAEALRRTGWKGLYLCS